jgi:hypothetical protein
MSVTFYDYTVPTIQSALRTLKHILRKAEEHGDSQQLVKARIIEDMRPLTFQVFDVCLMSDQIRAQLQGQEELSLEDDMRSFDDFYKRIDRVSELVDKIDRDTFNAYAEKTVSVGGGLQMRGADMVRDMCMPHLWFHLTTAYDILRKEGIPVGKKDYVGAWVQRHV